MSKLIIFILFVCALYVLWRLVSKHKINSVFAEQRQELSQLIQSGSEDDELPEKSKIIKQIKDEARQKANSSIILTEADIGTENIEEKVVELTVNDEDQRLFDAAAKLFFEKALRIRDFHQTNQIQHDMLNKMPMNTYSQIGSFDGDEWSIFWSYHDQSLEYYVGRYGVFYAHVDRDGIEHKAEFKDRY